MRVVVVDDISQWDQSQQLVRSGQAKRARKENEVEQQHILSRVGGGDARVHRMQQQHDLVYEPVVNFNLCFDKMRPCIIISISIVRNNGHMRKVNAGNVVCFC